MKERVKTALLVVLVGFSLLQSYLLAYSQPEFDPISQDEYVEAEWIGEQQALKSLMAPHEIIVHKGENQHTVLYPNFQFYSLIFSELGERTFSGFREVGYASLNAQQMREVDRGLEIRFLQPVPINVLGEMVSLRSEASQQLDSITRIWITAREGEEEVRTYFFTKSAVFEATNGDLMMRDLEQFIRYGEQLQLYAPQRFGEFYLPDEPIVARKVKLAYESYTAEQLQTSLFADPGASRSLLEQDGTEIFTDGKRGLQIDYAQHWMRFSDPSAPIDQRASDVTASLNAALKFVNRHGGWNGQFLLEGVETSPYSAIDTLLFRQYYAPLPNQAALPIISPANSPFGYIEVTVQQGMITNYERSLLSVDLHPVEVTEVVLPGGEELRLLLEANIDLGNVETVFPGYEPAFAQDGIVLIPKWVAKTVDGEYLMLN